MSVHVYTSNTTRMDTPPRVLTEETKAAGDRRETGPMIPSRPRREEPRDARPIDRARVVRLWRSCLAGAFQKNENLTRSERASSKMDALVGAVMIDRCAMNTRSCILELHKWRHFRGYDSSGNIAYPAARPREGASRTVCLRLCSLGVSLSLSLWRLPCHPTRRASLFIGSS